ncbi:hypothetical protein BH09VER1_BH09VER1_20100 [soil metagenome]
MSGVITLAHGEGEILKDKKDTEDTSQGRLQLEVMDLSDQYVAAMWAAMDEYIKNEPDPAKRVAAQNWKITFGSSSMEIAASSDPRLNLLDMAVFISAGKWSVNSYWVPQVFGPKAARLQVVYARIDKEIWELVDRVLVPKQKQDLRNLISSWKAQNPEAHEVANVRLRNLEGVHLADFDESTTAKGILASVRKLLGRVDTSLLYGERVMFYMERTPRILNQQTDLTLYQIAEAFPIAAVRPDFSGISDMFKGLPQAIQAGIDQNQGLIREIAPQIRSSVESADHLVMTLDGTMKSLKELSDSLKVTLDAVGNPADTIKQADSALSHLDSTVTGLNQLLVKDGTGESRVSDLTKVLDARADHILDSAFQKALILIGVVFVGIILTLIVARLLFARPKTPQS